MKLTEATKFHRKSGGGPIAKRQPSPDPDFLWTLLALAHFMRLSLTKAAHADFGSAPCRKSGEGLGYQSHDPERRRRGTGLVPSRMQDRRACMCRAYGAQIIFWIDPSPSGLG
jgi:hypothetical protein